MERSPAAAGAKHGRRQRAKSAAGPRCCSKPAMKHRTCQQRKRRRFVTDVADQRVPGPAILDPGSCRNPQPERQFYLVARCATCFAAGTDRRPPSPGRIQDLAGGIVLSLAHPFGGGTPLELSVNRGSNQVQLLARVMQCSIPRKGRMSSVAAMEEMTPEERSCLAQPAVPTTTTAVPGCGSPRGRPSFILW